MSYISAIGPSEEQLAAIAEQEAANKARQEARTTAWGEYNALTPEDLVAQFQPSYTKTLNYDGGPGEAARYNAAGFTDPWLAGEWKQYTTPELSYDVPSWLRTVWDQGNPTLDPVGTLGQRISRRGDMPDFSSSEEALKGAYGSLGYGDTGSLSYVPQMLGLSADPSMASWMGNNTAAAQAARDNDGLFGGFGDIGKLAMLAAAVYAGIPAVGAEMAVPAAVTDAATADALAETAAMSSWASEAPTWMDTLGSSVSNVANAVTSNPLYRGASMLNTGMNAASGLNRMLNPPAIPRTVSGLRPAQTYQQSQEWNSTFGRPLSTAIRGA